MYYTYILRCADHSLYTGITADFQKRMHQHFTHHPKAAKYTKSHPPQYVEALWLSDNKAMAARLEYRIKKLSKKEKEDLIIHNNLEDYFKMLNVHDYTRLNAFPIIKAIR